MRHFAWKLELVPNILWPVVGAVRSNFGFVYFPYYYYYFFIVSISLFVCQMHNALIEKKRLKICSYIRIFKMLWLFCIILRFLAYTLNYLLIFNFICELVFISYIFLILYLAVSLRIFKCINPLYVHHRNTTVYDRKYYRK